MDIPKFIDLAAELESEISKTYDLVAKPSNTKHVGN
jgi:hypothetical protein